MKLIKVISLKQAIEVQQNDLWTFLQRREYDKVNPFVDKLNTTAPDWLFYASGGYAPELIEDEAT